MRLEEKVARGIENWATPPLVMREKELRELQEHIEKLCKKAKKPRAKRQGKRAKGEDSKQ